MELVHGVPITEFCNENRLTAEERLKLFVKVCHAVQHAHQKGIIHRDLKPSNILVTMHDDEPVPKVIDFGIAKATHHDLTDKTLFTQFRHFLGTPAYMSPEQAQMSGLGVDTRSDIYSLGVLLYELLTGCTPLDLKPALESGYDEVRRTIREEDPPKPSTRLSQFSPEQQTSYTKQLRAGMRSMESQLRGDLDWIIMRAIEKDRSCRYGTVEFFAQDIEAFLRDDPVSAVAPSPWYLLRKLARRHKPLVASLLLLLPTITLAAVVSFGLLARERAANRLLTAEEAQTRGLTRELNERLEQERLHTYVGDIRSAESLVAENRLGEALALLNRYNPKYGANEEQARVREFSWYWLHAKIRNMDRSIAVPEHQGEISGIAFSPDSRLLVSTSRSGEVFVWSVASSRLITRLEVSRDTEDASRKGWWDPQFSDSGRYLIVSRRSTLDASSGDADLEVRIWERDGVSFRRLESHHFNALHVGQRQNHTRANVFIPGTNRLLLCQRFEEGLSKEYGVTIVDLDSPGSNDVIPNTGTIRDLSPDGRLLLAQRWFGEQPELVVWDLASRKELNMMKVDSVASFNFLDKETLLFSERFGSRRTYLLNIESLEEGPSWGSHGVFVHHVKRAANGAAFLYIGNETWVVNSRTGAERRFGSRSTTGTGLALSFDGAMCAMAEEIDGEARIRIIDLSVRSSVDSVVVSSEVSGGFSADGSELLVVPEEQNRTWAFRVPNMDASRETEFPGVLIAEFETGERWYRGNAWSESSGYELLRVEEGRAPRSFQMNYPIGAMWKLESGHLLLMSRLFGRIEVRDRDSLELLQERGSDEGTMFSDLRSALAVDANILGILRFGLRTLSSRCEFLNAETLEVLPVSDNLVASAGNVAFVPFRNRFFIFESDRVHELSVPELTAVASYSLGEGIWNAAVSRDGRTIATSQLGFTKVKLICAQTRQQLLELEPPIQFGAALRFSPRGDLLTMEPSFLFDENELAYWPAPRGNRVGTAD